MRADKARVEGEFRKQRLLALLEELKRGWLVLLLVALLLAWVFYWALTPHRDAGLQAAEVLGVGVRESKTGSYPTIDVRLDDGSKVTVRISRGDVVLRGARVQLQVMEHGHLRSYRYVQTLPEDNYDPQSNGS